MTLRRALAPEGDSVIYQDRVVHVASWASKFLFKGEQLNQPVGRLSEAKGRACFIASAHASARRTFSCWMSPPTISTFQPLEIP